MQIIRTVIWVLLLVALLAFSWANWDPNVTVKIWDNLVIDTKIPAIVIVSFLIGFVPMWLLHRGNGWRLKRRIDTLEKTVRDAAAIPAATAPSTSAPRAPEGDAGELTADTSAKPADPA